MKELKSHRIADAMGIPASTATFEHSLSGNQMFLNHKHYILLQDNIKMNGPDEGIQALAQSSGARSHEFRSARNRCATCPVTNQDLFVHENCPAPGAFSEPHFLTGWSHHLNSFRQNEVECFVRNAAVDSQMTEFDKGAVAIWIVDCGCQDWEHDNGFVFFESWCASLALARVTIGW